jgi:hypothetical protein
MLTKLFERLRLARLPDERKLYPHIFEPHTPDITVGTIIFRALVKISMIILSTWFVMEYYPFQVQQYLSMPIPLLAIALIYFIAVFPAYRQYQQFHHDSKRRVGGTLCSKCRYYDGTGVICTLYDEHVSKTHIPCGGESWEAKNLWDNSRNTDE